MRVSGPLRVPGVLTMPAGAISAIDDRAHTGITAPGQFDNMAIWFRAEVGC